MAKIELVVFDMAGTTIIDKKEVESCFAGACLQTNLLVDSDRILSLQGYSKIEVFQLLWEEKIGKDSPNYKQQVLSSYNLFCEILEHHYSTNPVVPTAGCLEIFEFLKSENIKIALTTGFYRKVADIILNKLGWLEGLNDNYVSLVNPNGFINCSITSDMVASGRPSPLMIQEAMKRLRVSSPKSVINIGDTPSDLISGSNANCFKSYGLSNGTHTQKQLEAYPNSGILENLTKLSNIIKYIKS